MKNENYEGGKAGFSLVEVLFAMIFMTIIVFGVISLQTSNIRLSNTQNNENKAYFLSGQGAEIAEALGASGIVGCAGSCTRYITFADPNYALTLTVEPVIDGIFDRKLEIATDPALSGAYQVKSIVEWTDSSGDHEVNAKRIVY